MATASLSEDTSILIDHSGFTATFLIENMRENTSGQYRRQKTEVMIVILALEHEPNPAPSKPASIC